MADYYNPNELRMSSSAFAWGDLVFTDYKSGCLRKILIQSMAVQAPVKAKYTELGDLNEKRREDQLKKEGKLYQREVTYSHPIRLFESINKSGHLDFLICDSNSNPEHIEELKSVQSTNIRKRVIKDGNYLTENLAQTVNYMMEAKVSRAKLIYTFYKKDKKTEKLEPEDERIFRVSVDDYGRIFVDKKPTQFTVQDLIAHEHAAARVIRDKIVWPDRPFRGEIPFVGSCHWCPFKKACSAYDSGSIEGTTAFVEFAKSLVSQEKENVEEV